MKIEDGWIWSLCLGPLIVVSLIVVTLLIFTACFKFVGYVLHTDPCEETIKYCEKTSARDGLSQNTTARAGFSRCITDTIKACKEVEDAQKD